MPKNTFENLNETKKAIINEALIEEFSTHPLDQATVKSIVEKTGIPRGSFYQYFESLEDSYFYILEKETSGIHILFEQVLKSKKGNMIAALKEYEHFLIEEIFHKNKHSLYKNRYLNWTMKLEKNWKKYLSKKNGMNHSLNMLMENEILNFVKGIIHSLIERCFAEELSKEEFSKIYRTYMLWIEGGIQNDKTI